MDLFGSMFIGDTICNSVDTLMEWGDIVLYEYSRIVVKDWAISL